MGFVIPAFYLALLHIAGDNLAVVPDLAAQHGGEMFIITIIAYLLIGSIVTGLLAWIGVYTGKDLISIVNKIGGCKGKKLCALITLMVCLPASSVTGGYYGGFLLSTLTGIEYPFASFICIIIYSLLALGYFPEILKISNMVSLILIPLVIIGTCLLSFENLSTLHINGSNIDWLMVFALAAYNSGGMRSLLVVEAAAVLSKRGCKVIYFSILGKIVEGVFTLLIVHCILLFSANTPVALAEVFGYSYGIYGKLFFYIAVLCTFTNTMVPAMVVNAKQINILFKTQFWIAMMIAIIIIYLTTFISLSCIMRFLSMAGIIMIVHTCFMAVILLKKR